MDEESEIERLIIEKEKEREKMRMKIMNEKSQKEKKMMKDNKNDKIIDSKVINKVNVKKEEEIE